MIGGLNPRKLVYRDGTSQSQRIIAAPDPNSINIEERTLRDLLEFATSFAKYLNFYNEENKATGDWSGFLNGGVLDSIGQQKWLAGLINYAEGTYDLSLSHQGTPFSSPHLALFVTFLKLLDNIKLQVNDFTKKHLDLYYEELLGMDKKKPVPDVANIIVQLTADMEKLLVPKGTQLMAGKDSEGKDLIYQTEKDTMISQAAVKNIRSLFVDKKVIGLREKRQNNTNRLQIFKEIMNMALGYDTFDPELSGDNLTATALKYLLLDAELNKIVRSADPKKKEEPDWECIYQTLEKAYRRLMIRNRQQATERPPDLLGLLQIALGDNDGHLPDLNNNQIDTETLNDLFDQAEAKDNTPQKALAVAYVTGKLMLSVPQFTDMVKSLSAKEITDLRWREIYVLLETARSKRKDLALAVPQETEWKDIVAVDDVKAIPGASAQVQHFKTFGVTSPHPGNGNNKPVSLGMAIASPRLLMREGVRNIDVYIAFNATDRLKTVQLANAINQRGTLPPPFLFYISTGKGWKKLTEKAMSFGDFLLPESEGEQLGISIKDGILSSATEIFFASGIGEHIIMQDGSVYRIDKVIDPKRARATMKAKMPGQPFTRRYTRTELYLNVIHVRFELSETDPEILAPGPDDNTIKLQHDEPVLAFMLNNRDEQSTLANGFNSWYQKFHGLTIANIRLDVDVNDIKSLSIQNEYTEYNPKKPFMPFGAYPRSGNRFYFSHPEIAGKMINSLTLKFNWMDAPESFKKYYSAYWDIIKNDMGGLNTQVTGNEFFLTDLTMIDHDLPLESKKITLFNKTNATLENKITTPVNWLKASARDLDANQLNSRDEVINWKRYFVLELKNDFKQLAYPTLVTRQALNYTEYKELVLNPPYVPILKQLTAGYKTSVNINFEHLDDTGSFFHISPFGYAKPTENTFMPRFDDQGELYLGLTGLGYGQNLSLLFQLTAGSGDPDVQRPNVQWSYLDNNQWIHFPRQAILSDSTNGLLNTGLLELVIPAGLSNNNTLMADSLYWLRATVNNGTASIPNLADVMAQGLSVVFINNNNAADHLAEPLKPMSITSAMDRLPGVKTLAQPFASMYGKPGETVPLYYSRVSERLRHKNRALTMWDYERLVLEEFPEIYKVKCLPGNFSGTMQDTGGVDVIVIPSIQGRQLFNSFQPKLPADALLRISNYLDARIPPFVTVTVKNPTYVQLRVRTAVRIKYGYLEAYCLEKLDEELKKFLAPWAYDEQAEIVIGGSIYHNVIVNFIAEKPYIDHVSTIKLLQSVDGVTFRDVLNKETEGDVSIVDPNVILVSADSHEIRVLTDEEFLETSTEGIGYMAVDVDLKIS
ncbi:baseplate J/gp47 family protein [Pedobacter alluvionis]|uniref:Uncharacterized protein n=1 Tax=Pedobacter alluvionis TaxID=475253 RepID=A0A497YGA7_9SPHI|nr:baseplate J/gp47 family protein [Pedobacter alluvionis]RLJ79420.1 hypothetical protein BCL90_0113 [Pedobacter alluvionis]TFB30769.1 hypothetical protein E3V97_09020 [Pedobacter alluvionis]